MAEPLDKLNAKVFAEHLHTTFKVHLDGAPPLELKLFEVTERATGAQGELFFIYFRGPLGQRLPQGIYHLEHEKLGRIDIFFTAVAADEQGVSYEAVFNRQRKRS